MKPNSKNIFIFNTGWVLLEKIFRMGGNFFIWALIIRFLGPKEFGRFSYYQAICLIVIPFFDLGINKIVKKELTLEKNRTCQLLFTCFWFKFLFGMIFTVLFSGFFIFFKGFDSDFWIFLILLLGNPLRAFDVFEINNEVQLNSKLNTKIKTISFISSSLLYGILLYTKASIIYFAVVFTCEFLITGLMLALRFSNIRDLFNFKVIEFLIFKKMVKEAFPILLGNIFIAFFMKSNQLLIEQFLTTEAVGIYSVAVRLSEMWIFVPASIAISSFVPVTQNINEEEGFSASTRKIFSVMTLCSLLIAAIFLISSSWIINFFYGKEFHDAILISKILVISNLFVFWGFAQEAWDIAKKKLKFRLFRVITGALLNLLLNLWLIPKFGVLGAAYSTFFTFFYTYFLSNFLGGIDLRRIFFIQLKSLLFWKELKADFNNILLKKPAYKNKL